MSQTHPETPAALPRTAPAAEAAPPRASVPVRKPGQWLLLLALAVAFIALVMSGLLWQKLAFTQEELARRSQDSASMSQDARKLAAQTEALAQELQARLSVAEVRLSEVSLQRSQLEELMLTLSRSRDDNLVQDLESALRLAQQQTQLTGSAQPLVSALQAADQRIARAAQPRLNPVQRAIARDIERIQSAALADIPALALRLDELARQVNDWPLANAVGVRADAQAAAFVQPGDGAETATPSEIGPTTRATPEAPEAGAAGGSELQRGWQRVSAGWNDLWARVWVDLTRSGRELVRVSRIDRPEAALLAPEQAFYLRENVKLKLLNARLGLLGRHMASSQADVAAVEAALQHYFDTRSPRVAQALGVLGALRQDLVDTGLPRPEESLAALAAAAGGR
ncbi:MAG: uroporphyrinogen-III C-methyltransferase [Hydrogenophaga sp.]|nr:uroporphyrinogen-III C-methyltransferase [Hydrogenophaga sp.]